MKFISYHKVLIDQVEEGMQEKKEKKRESRIG